jgi:hypothetical protein
MVQPYVGITGFMEQKEIVHLLERVHDSQWNGRRLMVGVLVSQKTKGGKQNKWVGSYPHIEKVPELFIEDNRCLNLIHYNTDQPERLTEELEELLELAGENCHGFQVNACWPSAEQLSGLRTRHPGLRIVLQVGKQALEQCHYSEGAVLDKVASYADAKAITGILYDPSGGLGVFSNLDTALPILQEISAADHCIGIGLAGGLRAERLRSLSGVASRIPQLSLDAQGQLRWPEEEPHTNRLDLSKAYAYLIAGLTLFNPNM